MLNIHLFGYENYNNTRCAIGEFKFDDNWLVKIWIDANKGTYLKVINVLIDDNGSKQENIEEFLVTYDVVKETDVQKPDLKGYTKIENDD